MPGYFCGDTKAETVIVNLNPGKREENFLAEDAKAGEYDNEWISKIKGGKQSISKIVEDFIQNCRNAEDGCNAIDNGKTPNSFDKKTAAFLLGLDDPKLNAPEFNFVDEKDEEKAKEKAKAAVKNSFRNKLQLEFIPYASGSMNLDFAALCDEFVEYTNDTFDIIFSETRRTVIFASRQFDCLFKKYETLEHPKKNSPLPPENLKYIFTCKSGKDGESTSIKLKNGKSQSVTRIIWEVRPKTEADEQEPILVVIAATFPLQSISTSWGAMKQYGRFCADGLNNLNQSK